MVTMDLLHYSVVASLMGLTGSLIYWSLKLGITPTPTSRKLRQSLQTLLPKQITGDIHELGAGWGHLLPLLAKQYPDNPLYAHERSSIPRWMAKCFVHIWAINATVTHQDIFTTDLSRAGLIVCYLYPKAMCRLAQQLAQRLPPGCWILTHTFRLPGWAPVKTINSNDLYQSPVYLYMS